MAELPHQKRSFAGTKKRLPQVHTRRRKIAVKVVDIFGNDTMTIVDVSVGDEKWLRYWEIFRHEQRNGEGLRGSSVTLRANQADE